MVKNPDFSLDDLDVDIGIINEEPIVHVEGKSDQGGYVNKKYTSEGAKLHFAPTYKIKPYNYYTFYLFFINFIFFNILSFNH
ncbi:MAG: hypothetical protein AB3N34_01850 [Lettuce witches'-broom phytoplasma]